MPVSSTLPPARRKHWDIIVINAVIVDILSIDANASSQLVQSGGLFFIDSADPDLVLTQAVKTQKATQAVET